MKKSYNETQYEGISKILKNMPRIDAPDNFEFNLMTRIENKNFGELIEEKQSFGLFWKLTPAAAVITSVVILFFVWNDQLTEVENPLMVMPPEIAIVETTPVGNLDANDVAMRSSAPVEDNNTRSREAELYRVVVRSNDVVSHERVALNLSGANNVDLDSHLNGEVRSIAGNNSSRLVGGGETFEFNGFYIREQTDKRVLEEIKSRVDSMRNSRRDSLKQQTNLPE